MHGKGIDTLIYLLGGRLKVFACLSASSLLVSAILFFLYGAHPLIILLFIVGVFSSFVFLHQVTCSGDTSNNINNTNAII